MCSHGNHMCISLFDDDFFTDVQSLSAKRSHPHLCKRQRSQASVRSSVITCLRPSGQYIYLFFGSQLVLLDTNITNKITTSYPATQNPNHDIQSQYSCSQLPPPIQASSNIRELHTTRWYRIRALMCNLRPTVTSASDTQSTQSQEHHLPSRATPTRSTSRLWMASGFSLLLTC